MVSAACDARSSADGNTAFFGIDGTVNAINDVHIGDTMVTSSHDWATLLARGAPPAESPTVMRTLDDIVSDGV